MGESQEKTPYDQGSVISVDSQVSPEEAKRQMKSIMKNIILISVAFLMNFNAYQSLARLQSTLNIEDSIGEYMFDGVLLEISKLD